MAHIIHGRTALVLYGSETGNAQDIAEEIGRLCERLRFQTQLAELNTINLVCRDTFTVISIVDS
jgi:flavodoxin